MGLVKKNLDCGGQVRPFQPASDSILVLEVDGRASGVEADPLVLSLMRDNEGLQEQLVALGAAAAKTEIDAREEGRREGRAEAGAEESRREAVLTGAIEEALKAWRDRLQDLDGLAALVARSALARLFDDAQDHADFVTRALARQMRILGRQSVVTIRVSVDDFPDAGSLKALEAGARTGSLAIEATPELPPGSCLLDLKLGHVDLGVRAQWAELAELLQAMAEGADQ